MSITRPDQARRHTPLGTLLGAVGRLLRRDPLSTFLLAASAAVVIVFFVLLGSLGGQGSGEEVPLSTLTRLAEEKSLRSVTLLDYDHQAEVETTTGAALYANYPSSDSATQGLVGKLGRAGTTVEVDPQSGKSTRVIVVQFLLPILLLVCLFAFFMRQLRGGGGVEGFSSFRGGGRGQGRDGSGIGFDSVAGAGEAVAELREIRDFLAEPERYRQAGATIPKGVLLVGPPGTGKTLLARATAGEADAAFFSVSGAEFVESLVGVGAARVRDLFAMARRAAPAIVFIDELDAAGRKRGAGVGQGNDEREQTLNQLLIEMDGFGGESGIVVMAATNRPDILDPALMRSGRFDRQVVVDVPDLAGREEILALHARGRRLAPGVDLFETAKLCPGFSGAELANLVNEAALLSVREGIDAIDQRALEEAIDRVVAGPANRSRVLSEEERWTIAIHEASHAVAIRTVGGLGDAQKVSIVARGRQLGTSAQMLVERDAAIHQREDLERNLIAILAGTAGEQIEFGQESTAAGDDLLAATRLARQMVTSFGMSPRLGPVAIGETGGEVFLGANLQSLGTIGPEVLDAIDAETERLVKEARDRGERALRVNWEAVGALARELLIRESLSGPELDAVIGDLAPTPLAELR
jgi:cell division protease FtsH